MITSQWILILIIIGCHSLDHFCVCFLVHTHALVNSVIPIKYFLQEVDIHDCLLLITLLVDVLGSTGIVTYHVVVKPLYSNRGHFVC